ncbi:cytochrome c maturation protein CcmE [Alphaproteobacteria bacterium]|jgi:cytochrome c-type biogenesis protein CcmE|nr:cytochrome c maturation protein CcmE [Alphaproteobacteria bacterium]MDB2584544.1 cytochrome c maturation protein CcmE [Alphaproteobacteria bacterium]MDC0969549.1 cytochrome c maturation protein CcmE [Alphaproteobacteria bacterium]MDC1035236.1 cytochrome c maturation protein CcmE [Alphaproteobacteria bacterium]
MNPKYRRLFIIILIVFTIALATQLVLIALRDNIIYFFTPNELKIKYGDNENIKRKIRVGGLVLENSLVKNNDIVNFTITDNKNEILVVFNGQLPDLFREGQGIVAEGNFKDNKLIATQVLAKHDENYMPPEVADALKKNGAWKGDKDK